MHGSTITHWHSRTIGARDHDKGGIDRPTRARVFSDTKALFVLRHTR